MAMAVVPVVKKMTILDRAREYVDLFVEDPPSAEIAAILTELHSETCPHGLRYCSGLCGVWRYPRPWCVWKAIDKSKRMAIYRHRVSTLEKFTHAGAAEGYL